jgi:hypothetical protein
MDEETAEADYEEREAKEKKRKRQDIKRCNNACGGGCRVVMFQEEGRRSAVDYGRMQLVEVW